MAFPLMKFLWISGSENQQYLPLRNVYYYLLASLVDMKINLSRTKTSTITQMQNANAVCMLGK